MVAVFAIPIVVILAAAIGAIVVQAWRLHIKDHIPAIAINWETRQILEEPIKPDPEERAGMLLEAFPFLGKRAGFTLLFLSDRVVPVKGKEGKAPPPPPPPPPKRQVGPRSEDVDNWAEYHIAKDSEGMPLKPPVVYKSLNGRHLDGIAPEEKPPRAKDVGRMFMWVSVALVASVALLGLAQTGA